MTDQHTTSADRSRNIAVGLTALIGLVGLIGLLVMFGYLPALLRGGYSVTVYLDDLAGLHPDSRVTLWGRDIGEVAEVGFAPAGAPQRAYAKLRIDEAFAVPRDVIVRVQTPLFGGGPVVALVGSKLGADAVATDGTGVLATAQIVNPLKQLEAISADFTHIAQTWGGVGDHVNRLFGSEQGHASLPRVVMGFEQRLDQLKGVLAGVDQFVSNEQFQQDIKQTAAHARRLSASLNQAVVSLEKQYSAVAQAIQSRMAKVDTTLDSASTAFSQAGLSMNEISKRYVALADDASKVMAGMDKLVHQAQSKKSTVGMLLHDPQLYHNLTDTSERLKLMVDEARLLIDKWKAEGLHLRVFD